MVTANHTVLCAYRFAILDVPAGLGRYEIDIDGCRWLEISEHEIQQSDFLVLG